MQPLIGITCESMQAGPRTSPSLGIQVAYVKAVRGSGAVPVLLPHTSESSAAANLLDHLDGLILSGGGDLDPALYGQASTSALRHVDSTRDHFELTLTRLALQRQVPLLGICRGLQVINVACGGTLIQHIPSQHEKPLQHDAQAGQDALHAVQLDVHTQLHRILPEPKLTVNSAHHQGVQDLGEGLRHAAWSSDGIVEAVECGEHVFAIGVQWHPERIPNDPASQALFKALTHAAQR